MTTNREKLAKMTNEELAEFFDKESLCVMCIYKYQAGCLERDCEYGTLQWLNQESEENNDMENK